MSNVIAIAEQVARACIPDLDGLGLAIVESSELGGMFGCFHAGSQRPGEVVIHVRRGMVEQSVVASVLHELSHWLAREGATVAKEQVEFAASVSALNNQHAGDTADPARMPTAFWSHNDSFIRAAVHFWWRCCRVAGFFLRPEWIGIAGAYPTLEAMSEPGRYVEVLDEECQQHRGRSMASVLAIEPNPAFKKLCDEDFVRVLDAVRAARQAA